MPPANRRGEAPKRRRRFRANLTDSPEAIMAAVSIKAPRIKNTAGFPKRAKASDRSIAPVTGRSRRARSPVTAMGITSEAHRMMQRRNIERVCLPRASRPSGRGSDSVRIKTTTARIRIMTLRCDLNWSRGIVAS